jgi:hypothetical protein
MLVLVNVRNQNVTRWKSAKYWIVKKRRDHIHCSQNTYENVTFITNSMVQSPWKAIVAQLLKKFPAVYGTRVYKSPPLDPILSQMNAAHTLTRTISLKSIQISSHLQLGLPSDLFPSGFTTKIIYAFISPIRAKCLAHFILLDWITQILCQFTSYCFLWDWPIKTNITFILSNISTQFSQNNCHVKCLLYCPLSLTFQNVFQGSETSIPSMDT